ncbi:MAG: inorganic phosphate transporter [Deltaproteobacteria bacterium]|nr:MAG: inorganic phosphate transporter [Deltaproteobacteria bacterium]
MDGAILGVPIVIAIAGVLALYMAWAIGANDVANAMGTSVGSGALTIKRAVIVAAIFEFAGAFLAGGHVTDTVRKGILDTSLLTPDQLMWGMLGALASAGTLLIGATRIGLPVSTTHAIVGSIVGFGSVAVGVDTVEWGRVGLIAVSWLTSPLLGAVMAFLVFSLVRRLILNQENPVVAAQTWGPLFFFMVFFVIAMVTVFKGLKNLSLDLAFPQAVLAAVAIGGLGAFLGRIFLKRVRLKADVRPLQNVERIFVVLQVLTACAVAFAHGSNDVANAIGPLAAVVHVVQGADLTSRAPVEPWMLIVGGLGIVLGLATWGYRVMETVGKKITQLTPSSGFAATLAAAFTVVIASRMGIPVSTTHILVGSVLGVGLARGIGAIDLRVVGRIIISWVLTLPIAAGLSVFFFFFFKGLLAG